MKTTKELLYAAIGAGDLALGRIRKASESLDLRKVSKEMSSLRADLPKRLSMTRSKISSTGSKAVGRSFDVYQGLVGRGKKAVLGIRESAPTRRTVSQTKSAQQKTKAAVTSVNKAASAAAEAAKQAASNL